MSELTPDQRSKKEAVEHGIEAATYALAPIGKHGEYRPTMHCFCGFSTGHSGGRWVGLNDNWEETGIEFDRHLESTK